jgi:hypothetical protein
MRLFKAADPLTPITTPHARDFSHELGVEIESLAGFCTAVQKQQKFIHINNRDLLIPYRVFLVRSV